MRLLVVTLACLATVEARGRRVEREYKCTEMPDGTGRCITSGGVTYNLPQKVNLNVLGERLVPALPTSPFQSTEATPTNRTQELPSTNVSSHGPVLPRSALKSPLNSSESAPEEQKSRVNSNDFSASSSNVSKVERSLPRNSEVSSPSASPSLQRAAAASSSLPSVETPLVRWPENRSSGGRRVSIPPVDITSVLIVPQVAPATVAASDDRVGELSNATSAPLESSSSAPLVHDHDVSGRSRKGEEDFVDIRSSSLTWCCCEEILSQRNTQALLRERGVAAELQLARPQGLTLSFCRAASCGGTAAVARCVQKYRTAAVTIQENNRRRNFFFKLEDGCKCGPKLDDETDLLTNVGVAASQSTPVGQSSGQSPADVDSTVNNIADLISDGVVKLASVSRKMLSLVGISSKSNDARALAQVLNETAGLIERAADQLLDLNSAVTNVSLPPRLQLPFQVVATRTVTVITCLQPTATVSPVHTTVDAGQTIQFSFPSLPESLFVSRSSSVTDLDLQSGGEWSSGVLGGSSVASSSLGVVEVPGAGSPTETSETTTSVVYLPYSHTTSLQAFDLKSEIHSPTLLPSSNSWLPRPVPDESIIQSSPATLGPTALATEEVTVVTRITTLVVVSGLTFTYSPSDPSTSVTGNGGLLPTTIPRFQSQTVFHVDNSTSSTTFLAHSLSSSVQKYSTEDVLAISPPAPLAPATTTVRATAPIRLPGGVSRPTFESVVPTSPSGITRSSTGLAGPAGVTTLIFDSQELPTVHQFPTTTKPAPEFLPSGTVQFEDSNNVITDPLGGSSSSTNALGEPVNILSQEDKVLKIAKSLVTLKEKMKECLVNETAETKSILGLHNGDFLAQPLQQQALLMPIWREFAASNILNDFDQDTLGQCLRDLNTSAPLSHVPRDFSRGIKSLPKVSGLLMAVMELAHCTNVRLSCNLLAGEELKRRLAAAQLIGTILTESRRSQLNLLTLVDVFFVDSRNASSLSPDVLQMSLLSKITLIKEFERALQWSKSPSEGTDDLSVESLGIVLAYSAKLRPLLSDYAAICAAEASAVTTSTPSIVVQSSPTVGPISPETVVYSTVDSITSQTAVIQLPHSTTTRVPGRPQRPATFVPFAKVFTDLPQYHPIRLSKDELEKLIFP